VKPSRGCHLSVAKILICRDFNSFYKSSLASHLIPFGSPPFVTTMQANLRRVQLPLNAELKRALFVSDNSKSWPLRTAASGKRQKITDPQVRLLSAAGASCCFVRKPAAESW
jgi:hypothetical protein